MALPTASDGAGVGKNVFALFVDAGVVIVAIVATVAGVPRSVFSFACRFGLTRTLNDLLTLNLVLASVRLATLTGVTIITFSVLAASPRDAIDGDGSRCSCDDDKLSMLDLGILTTWLRDFGTHLSTGFSVVDVVSRRRLRPRARAFFILTTGKGGFFDGESVVGVSLGEGVVVVVVVVVVVKMVDAEVGVASLVVVVLIVVVLVARGVRSSVCASVVTCFVCCGFSSSSTVPMMLTLYSFSGVGDASISTYGTRKSSSPGGSCALIESGNFLRGVMSNSLIGFGCAVAGAGDRVSKRLD